MPNETRDLTGDHIDGLSGRAPPGATPTPEALTADEALVDGDLDQLVDVNAHVGTGLATKRPARRRAILARLDALASAANGVALSRLTFASNRITAMEQHDQRDTALGGGRATTAAAFKQVNYPRATLLQYCIKAVAKGLPGVADAAEAKEFFDPSTGKKYVPFENSIKVKTSAQLVYSAHLYAASMQAVTGEAPVVYHDFMRDVARVADAFAPAVAQKYLDLLLRYLDDGRAANMKALYASSEPSRIYVELYHETTKPGGGGGGGSGDGGARRIKKFGEVKTAIGGAGAGIIPKKCNCFHAIPQKACTAGVPADEGFPAHQVGLCAYQH
jgi:hypothetical protein